MISEKRKQYLKEYRQKNKAQIRAYRKEWVLKNPDKVKEHRKKNYCKLKEDKARLEKKREYTKNYMRKRFYNADKELKEAKETIKLLENELAEINEPIQEALIWSKSISPETKELNRFIKCYQKKDKETLLHLYAMTRVQNVKLNDEVERLKSNLSKLKGDLYNENYLELAYSSMK